VRWVRNEAARLDPLRPIDVIDRIAEEGSPVDLVEAGVATVSSAQHLRSHTAQRKSLESSTRAGPTKPAPRGDQIYIVLTMRVGAACSTSQKVERQVVSNTEQPALGVLDRPVRQASFQGAQQGLLHDVLASSAEPTIRVQ
jgi:hypothetical protein